MGEKDLRIRADELHRLGIACGVCKTEIVFEATAERGPGVVVCPSCSVTIPHATEIVMAYRDFFRQLSRASVTLLVRVEHE